MPDPKPCPECKVILNGLRISGNAKILADRVDKMVERGMSLPADTAQKMIAALNQAEDLVDNATREMIRVEYDGPLNKALAD